MGKVREEREKKKEKIKGMGETVNDAKRREGEEKKGTREKASER